MPQQLSQRDGNQGSYKQGTWTVTTVLKLQYPKTGNNPKASQGVSG